MLRDGQYVTLSNEELAEFEEKYPDIAKYWLQPETLNEISDNQLNSARKP